MLGRDAGRAGALAAQIAAERGVPAVFTTTGLPWQDLVVAEAVVGHG